jgi:hypothetical protein
MSSVIREDDAMVMGSWSETGVGALLNDCLLIRSLSSPSVLTENY